MSHELQFYIDGAWVDPIVAKTLDVIDPSTEQPFATISIGAKADVDRAVAAAKRAFETFGYTKPPSGSNCCTGSSRSTSGAVPSSPWRSRARWVRRAPTRSMPRSRPDWRISKKWPRC